MSRQDEIDKIYDLMDDHYWDTFEADRLSIMKHCNFLAQKLVDSGIGTKDRFYIWEEGIPTRGHFQQAIKPINYDKEKL